MALACTRAIRPAPINAIPIMTDLLTDQQSYQASER
jgi:hypothetical protein